MFSTPATPLPDHETEAIFSECLANARLTALRALLETVNTTDDPAEKRRAATAILRIPEPDAPPRRSPRPANPAPPQTTHHAAVRAPSAPQRPAAASPGNSTPAPTLPCTSANPSALGKPPAPAHKSETARTIEALLARVAADGDFLDDDDLLDSVTNLPSITNLNLGKSAAKLLAAAAGELAPRSRSNSRDPPS